MSADTDKEHDNVVPMPDIYGRVDADVKQTPEPADPPEFDGVESEGFDPYDTARLYKK